MKDYIEGYKLKDNELLLKINNENPIPKGFLTKLTKKGEIPISFLEWGNTYKPKVNLEIKIVEEIFKPGWKLYQWRFGMSQNWASMMHPDGYTVEIYLKQFLEIIKTHTIINGELIGEFKWDDHKLIKK